MNSKKLPNRFCDDPKAKVIPCSYCKYRLGLNPACEAYPEYIPADVLRQVYEHPDRECGNGYKWTPKEEITE